MRILFKATKVLLTGVQADLRRPHPFAAERVGFVSCRVGELKRSGLIVLAHDYHPVDDSDYLDDPTVGAMMGPGAIRKALQFAYNNEAGMFHVHIHDHRGQPRPSSIDLREAAKFVPDFWHVRPHMPHGILILSRDSATGLCWYPGKSKPMGITRFRIVGRPISAFGSC